MNLSKEKENYIKMSEIVLEIIPKYLRILFKEHWDKKYPEMKWQSDNASGKLLGRELGDKFLNNRMNKDYAPKLLAGNEQKWDTTILAKVMLEHKLNLFPEECKFRKGVEKLKKRRNESFGHLPKASCQDQEFAKFIEEVKAEVKGLFGEDAVSEIDQIANLAKVDPKEHPVKVNPNEEVSQQDVEGKVYK